MHFDEDQRASLDAVFKWRRDVRHFRSDPLPDGMMHDLERVMDKAPSVGNARPWRVFRVHDPVLRAAVRDVFTRCHGAAADAYDADERDEYLSLKLAGLDQAPEHLAVFTDTEPEQGRRLGRKTMPETLEQSTAMAVHTLWLAARARNVGLGMVSILDPAAINAIFDVPDHWRFSAYLCLGYADFTDDTPLLHRAGWQENKPTRWVAK